MGGLAARWRAQGFRQQWPSPASSSASASERSSAHSQVDSVGSIPARSVTKAQVTGGCIFRIDMMLACLLTCVAARG
jgi:hypothetical protein